MQTLWTRTAQSTCVCKCAFCRSTIALSRTTTSSALKRRIRFRDIFTVFYSTVLTSAAVADAYRKDARRKEWERVIQAAKEEVAAIEEHQRRRIASLSLDFSESSEATPPPKKTWLIENTWDKVFQSATNKSKERELLGFQDLVGPPLCTLRGISTDEIRELLSDPAIIHLNNGTSDGNSNSAIWSRPSRLRPYGLKQIKRAEWSVRKLAYQFLLSCEEDSSRRQVEADQQVSQSHSTSTTKQTILDRISTCKRALEFIISSPRDPLLWFRMRSPRVPSYKRQIDHDAASINDRLLKLFKSFEDSGTGIDTLLRSISTLLLFAPNPPDVHCYNMLIIGLCQLQQMTDVHAVIESMRECSVRPNAITLSAMLHYYTITQKETEFRRLTRQINGSQGGLFNEHPNRVIPSGLVDRYRTYDYSRKHTAIEAQDEELLFDQPRYSYSTPDGRYPLERDSTIKVVGTARMGLLDGTVYNALISGSLELGLLGQAMRYYSQMISDGFRPELSLLESILKHCTRNRDWDAGVAVWKQFCRLAEGIDRITIGHMLTLRHACGNYIEYGQVFDHGVQKGLIPSASTAFPSDDAVRLTSNMLDTNDLVAFPRQPYLQWCIVRKSLGWAVELLACQIAITALDLAAIEIYAREKSGGWRVYREYMKQYRYSHSPAEIFLRRTMPGGQGVFSSSKADTAKPAPQASCLSVSNAQSEVADQCWTKFDPSLGNEKSQKMLHSPLGGETSSSEDSMSQTALAHSYDALVLSPEIEEVQGSVVDDIRHSETPSIDREALNASIKLHADTEPLTEEKLKEPAVQLLKATKLAKEPDNPSTITWGRTQTTLEEENAESQLVQKPSSILRKSVSEDGLRPQRQQELQRSARGPVKLPSKGQAEQIAEAHKLRQSFLASVEQGSHSSDSLPSNFSVSALIELDRGFECLSDEKDAHEFLEKVQPMVGCVRPLERREGFQVTRSRIAESEENREYTSRSYYRKLCDDGTVTSNSTQTERSEENQREGGDVKDILPVERPFLRHLWEDTTQTSSSSTQPPLAAVYRVKISKIKQHSTAKHANRSLFPKNIKDEARPENEQYMEPSPIEKSPRKQLVNKLSQAFDTNNPSTIMHARHRKRTLKGRGGKPIVISPEIGNSAHLPLNSFPPNKFSCSTRRVTQALNPEEEEQESSWSPQSISAERKRSGHGQSVQWSVLEEPELSRPTRLSLASERDPRPARTDEETPNVRKEAQMPLLAPFRRLEIVSDTNSGSRPTSVIPDCQRIDSVDDATASGDGPKSACGEVENAYSEDRAQSPVYAFRLKQDPNRLRPIRPASRSPPALQQAARREDHEEPRLRPKEQPNFMLTNEESEEAVQSVCEDLLLPRGVWKDSLTLTETDEARLSRHGSAKGSQGIATVPAGQATDPEVHLLVPYIRKYRWWQVKAAPGSFAPPGTVPDQYSSMEKTVTTDGDDGVGREHRILMI